jgi:MYXO-CTERM domain-containing protein
MRPSPLFTAAAGLAGLIGLAAPAAAQTRNVDVLFVVDNSTLMAEEQVKLIESFQTFQDVLAQLPGGLPDLHIGVVSSNMGAGPVQINNCQGDGDDGILQVGPYFGDPDVPDCATRPEGRFISDIALPDGTRDRNYDGSMADTFACIARLGTNGCGFEQHLGAMRAALSDFTPENAGFLRDDAVLAVVVVANEDDCSASDTALYDPGAQEFGPISSFRCTRFGITCTEPIDGDTLGPLSNCAPDFQSDYLTNPQEFVDFLTTLKGDPQRVVFGAITGPSEPVAIGLDPNNPDNQRLLGSCMTSVDDEAAPAIRLNWLAAQFAHGSQSTVCSSDQTGALGQIAQQIGVAMEAFGTEPDAGPTPTEPDAGPGTPGEDAGSADNDDGGITPPTDKDDGCGCATTSSAGAATTGLFFLLGLLGFVAPRRRRR